MQRAKSELGHEGSPMRHGGYAGGWPGAPSAGLLPDPLLYGQGDEGRILLMCLDGWLNGR